ncbi:MAG TPA: hypothetical protein VMV72_00190 [Verrucomicrobiae bacterium]|nr:hypothetical protein [Verrucomicrobiae bacterium]
MAIHWGEIVSPQEGVKALFWDVFILGVVVEGLRRFYKKIPPETKRTIFIKVSMFLGWLAVMGIVAYCASQIIIVTTNHLAARTVALARKPPSLEIESAASTMAEVQKDTLVAVVLTLYNGGSPSIVKRWAMTITPPQGDPIHAPVIGNWIGPLTSLTPIPAMPGVEAETKTLDRKDWLYEKVLTTPIVEGGMQWGFVIFLVPQTSLNYLRIPGTKAELSFADVDDKEYKTELPLPALSRQ